MPIRIPRPIKVTSRRIDPASVGEALPDCLNSLPPETPVYSWLRRGEGLVGWGEAARIETSGPHRFDEATAWWQQIVAEAEVDDQVGEVGSGLVAFGAMTFAPHSAARSMLAVPRVLLGRRGDKAWVTTVATGADPAESPALAPTARAFVAPPWEATPFEGTRPASPGALVWTDGSLSASQWREAVARARSRIERGDLGKVVLARSVVATAERPVDVRHLIGKLTRTHATSWTFCVDGLVGATPELLVRLDRGLVTSRVLAGTILRTGDDDHDLALAASLAHSSKDREEHEFAVRSVADALRPLVRSLNVPDEPFVLHLPNVLHLASDVSAVASDHVGALDIAAALHPSAAVCGTPTAAAEAMLDELEHLDRGRYAGPVGWIDAHGDGEWGLALRCGQVDAADPHQITLFAGCGIVADSDPDAEVAESEAKLLPMRGTLS